MILCRPLYQNLNTCCTSYYEDFKLDYIGIVTRKWHDKGTCIYVEFLNKKGGVQVREGLSEELVENAKIGDTVIKKGGSVICSLITENKIMTLLYTRTMKGCNCPDTNKLK